MTQTLIIRSAPGWASPTIRPLDEFSDTWAAAAQNATAGSNDGSLYSAAFTGLAAGRYRVVLMSSGAIVASDFVTLSASGTFPTEELDPPTVALDSATQTQVNNIENASGYLLAVLAGACADPQTASETYAITVFGSTFTVDMAGQTSTGVRTAPTLTKT